MRTTTIVILTVVAFWVICVRIAGAEEAGLAIKIESTPTCLRALQELFKQYPGETVKPPIDLHGGGSYLAVEKLGKGEIDIACIEKRKTGQNYFIVSSAR